MRSANFRNRVERLEASRCPDAGKLIISACPLPDDAPTNETINDWLADGVAHTSRGRVIFYDGGEVGPLSEEQWRLRYCTAD
jgi:hypothetical protein